MSIGLISRSGDGLQRASMFHQRPTGDLRRMSYNLYSSKGGYIGDGLCNGVFWGLLRGVLGVQTMAYIMITFGRRGLGALSLQCLSPCLKSTQT